MTVNISMLGKMLILSAPVAKAVNHLCLILFWNARTGSSLAIRRSYDSYFFTSSFSLFHPASLFLSLFKRLSLL